MMVQCWVLWFSCHLGLHGLGVWLVAARDCEVLPRVVLVVMVVVGKGVLRRVVVRRRVAGVVGRSGQWDGWRRVASNRLA